ncbi:MAG: hypothetical protein US57_C0002G0059 [Candidatus Moranbacteria bacterium GW2011_GWC2_37_73]|nr:MAG: hypothetical protein UR95_C0002G0157 [Parcubacteria group bacterium GW2011_GWC1_36_108]KKQ40352.1 MAG: hypothetical protein US57_C0002G0059 [Candidatus Moranbacteria bacterium GW2011_GWC2_37_73]HAS00141.1 hypothetical protein [Candidatus Moranbacteria bacterium]HBU11071.1 hypothetical protein [Candidatus Moranbacteria bacterium]
MNVNFFAPFEWSGEIQTNFGIFFNELQEKTTQTDILIISFIIILLIPHVFKVLEDDPMKKIVIFLSTGNNSILSLALGCFMFFFCIALYKYGMQGLIPAIVPLSAGVIFLAIA